MKVSGFTYIRNGFKFGYPFIESIQSILPICDEVIVAVGNSEDGTREALVNLGKKIKIVDTIWDDNLRLDGRIFAQQCNVALAECTGDWLFHIQADEVIHEDDYGIIKSSLLKENENKNVDGFLFQFINFYGDYFTINNTRKVHKKEIRIIRNNKNIFSYKDSQGFRKFSSELSYNNGIELGEKLNIKEIKARVFHYNYVRNEVESIEKAKYFDRFWHSDKNIENKYKEKPNRYSIERVKKFDGTHPLTMNKIVNEFKSDFDTTKITGINGLKNKVIYAIEDLLGFKIGEYKNYKKI
ncbi:MAG: hypothetical protein RI955_781 [Bacteroidota bacterium]|jgi:glycosyltransferase involved in cell wall biosynthesis